ncbi:hypothetical protein Tco_0103237 [Tanacetum coccineum]
MWMERITKKRTKNKAKTTKPDSEWKSKEKIKSKSKPKPEKCSLAAIIGRVSFSPNDVVVALSAGEKGDGLTPSSITGEEVAVNPSGV